MNHSEPEKKNHKRLIIILIVVAILMIAAIICSAVFGGVLFKTKTTTSVSSISTPVSEDEQETDDSSKEAEGKETEKSSSDDKDTRTVQTNQDKATKEHYEISLTAGQYKTGTDIPAGTYALTVTSGSGNVSTDLSKGGLNELIGSEADGYSKQKLTSVKLRRGTTLSIGGDLILHCVSNTADIENQTERTTDETQTFDLQEGDYTAGKEFPAGTYNIIATGISGNVSSSNLYEGGLNEIMGTDGFGIKQYNNAIFQEGTILNISGTSVQLVFIGE